MKKIILACMLLFLATGCTIDYNLDVDKDFNFKENVVLSTSKENFEISYNSVDDGVIDIYNKISNDLKYPLDQYDLKKYFRKNVDVIFNNEYADKNELLSSPFLLNVNGKVDEYDTEQGTQIFQILIDYDFFELLKTKKYSSIPTEKVFVNIKFPYKIISSNADQVNENILSWDLKKLTKQRSFYIEYDKNELYEEKTSFMGAIIGVALLSCITLILVLKKKNKDKV